MPYRDDDAEELDEREYPEPDAHGNGHLETVPCPACRTQVYEEAVCCPRCGNYITREGGALDRPWWFVLGALVCLAVALAWILWI